MFASCVFALLLACGNDDDDTTDLFALETWLGAYEIDTIGVAAVDCQLEFLHGEIITLKDDFTFTIESVCTGAVLADGLFEFSGGIYSLFISFRVSEPDRPEFDLQFFEEENGRIRIYRCTSESGNCVVRKGFRVE